MSTIASPRDPSVTRRLPSNSPTPTSSTRPSLDISRSGLSSPVNSSNPTNPPSASAGPKRSNRAALREYYNLRAPRILVPDSEVPASDLDVPDFDADEYVARVVAESGLEDLLRLYTGVVGEVRALDAEKKALVYDNYSKLITATETIRKMRANMDPLNPMASTLDPAIAQIYTQASAIRSSLRSSIPAPDSTDGQAGEADRRRRKTQKLAQEVLATPDRLKALVAEGKMEEARRTWERPRRLLEAWREKDVGGDDVRACLEEGDGIVGRRGREEVTSTRTSREGQSARTSRDERSARTSRDERS